MFSYFGRNGCKCCKQHHFHCTDCNHAIKYDRGHWIFQGYISGRATKKFESILTEKSPWWNQVKNRSYPFVTLIDKRLAVTNGFGLCWSPGAVIRSVERLYKATTVSWSLLLLPSSCMVRWWKNMRQIFLLLLWLFLRLSKYYITPRRDWNQSGIRPSQMTK